VTDVGRLADQILGARDLGAMLAALPSSEDPAFDLATAYRVEAACVERRRAAGHTTAGLKVGFANKAVWRALKLSTLVWAHLYDDTVHSAAGGRATLSMERMRAPKIEPEIVFKLRRPIALGETDPEAVLDAVESLALGLEIVDCPFPGWVFQPPDFVAALGFHAALVVGEAQTVTPAAIPALVEALPRFTIQLALDDTVVEQGGGRNSLRSPALCLAELAVALARREGAQPLTAGDLVSTGSLTEARPITGSQTWTATVAGLALPPLTLQLQ
jgi:2-keto-4-pentenoate hydratase